MNRDAEPKAISPGWFCLYNAMAAPIISAGFHLARSPARKHARGSAGAAASGGDWKR